MSLHLHRAPRTDLLADALGELLAVPLPDPFAQEVVVVPARGVERWLTQRLSHRLGAGPRGGDGVCAGVRFLSPQGLIGMLLGRDADDPWVADRLVWPLLATIDASLDEPWCAPLARHLSGSAERADRRWSVAHRLARLFAAYVVQRPALVTDWREGRDTDGTGGRLDPDLAWQPPLWRALLARVAPVAGEPPDVRHAAVVEALRAGRDPHDAGLDLPDRLSLFGHTRLPVSEVALLDALAVHREVHLWLPQPSPELWTALAGLGGPVPRSLDPSAERVGHPLLASLGRDARELRRSLDVPLVDEPVGTDAVAAPSGLLGWLQHDLRANHAPDAAERATRVLRDDDRSLQVHACHGAARQVEVLREVLVGLLTDDPTLEPRDIVVMCPDIETFAPLISAGFGLGDDLPEAHPAHRLRVRLADRSLTSTNPLLAVAASLVELAGGRVTASQVLDLAGRAPCRLRFALTDDDLARVTRWVAEAGIRWGVDEQQRAAFSMQRFGHNTWRAGLDRVLLGVAMSGDDHRHVGRGLPVDDVASSDIDLAGRLAELVDRLARTLDALAAATDVSSWMTALAEGVRALSDVPDDDAWQLPQLERELARAGAGTAVDGAPVSLRLADVRALLSSRLAGRPTRANFRTGTLTVCTLVPMRSVPHRVVCLVGLDDGAFPRSPGVDGDDVLARRPLTGERDLRSEDRQLLLDAVLAATETLVVTYTGAGEHTGLPRPPAVPLGELLDAADRTAATPARERVLTHHPLQPHDPRNLGPGLLVADRTPPVPFSFDGAALAGARAAVAERVDPGPLLAQALPTRAPRDVSLEDLKAFLTHPVRTFLRERLGISTPFSPDEVDDAIPVQLGPLEAWQVGDHLLREVLAGADPTAVMTAEQLRGTLPPGGLGTRALHTVVADVQALLARTADLRVGPARAVDVEVDLGEGRRLTGTVTGVHGENGGRVVSLGYSRLAARQRITTWVDLLALSLSHPDQHWTGHAVGRERAGPKRALTGPVDDRAAGWLQALVALREEGLTRPVPAPVKTTLAWAEAHAQQQRGHDTDPAVAAERAWRTDPHNDYGIEGEDADAWHRRCYGDGAPLGVLLDAGLADAAAVIWGPLLDGAERVGPL